MLPTFPSSRCLPSHETAPSSLARARVARCFRWPAGQPPHVFIEVRKPRLDLSSPLFASAFQAACASYDFCRPIFPRARPRTTRTSRTTGNRGWDDCRPRPKVAFRSSATAEGTQGQGSRPPSLDALHRDCSWQRLRPDPDRFGHLLSRAAPFSLSGATREEDGAAAAARACMARAA
jgi:hypothetical protein